MNDTIEKPSVEVTATPAVRPSTPTHFTGPRAPENAADQLIVPDPVGHFMLVALPDNVTKIGSILTPDDWQDRERTASVIGTVMSLGKDCYQGTFPNGAPRFPNGPWCKEGDVVIFGRYAGHRFRVGGVEWRMLSDDQIVGIVPPGAKVEGI